MKRTIGPKNIMTLEIRSEEGRCAVEVDLTFLTRAERIFLFGLLQSAQEGAEVGFSVMPVGDGRSKAVIFNIADPTAPTIATQVRKEINGSSHGPSA